MKTPKTPEEMGGTVAGTTIGMRLGWPYVEHVEESDMSDEQKRSNYDSWKNSVGPGWCVMVHPLLLLADRYGLSVDQVKEKFGTLRFYWSGSVALKEDENGNKSQDLTKWFSKMVDGAEGLSVHICEECGLPGKTGNHGSYWIRTLCPICSAKKMAKIAAEKEAENKDHA